MKELVIIGADHAGVEEKERLRKILEQLGHPVEDVGSFAPKSKDDYPDFAKKVGKLVVKKKAKGILLCGTGTGMSVAANKVKGVRAAVGYDTYSAKMSRLDNDANILTLRTRNFPKSKYKNIIATWLRTKFSTFPRHKRRIEKIKRMER